MAKASKREWVWLQCSECGELNYRTNIHAGQGVPERLKNGMKKYCPRSRKHEMHKVKRK